MAATPEAKVKAKVKAILKSHGAYHFSPMTGGYGASGVPDIVCCYRGYFIGVECKAGKGKTTALQEANLAAIREQGGIAIVVRETDLDKLQKLLEVLHERDKRGHIP
jgi:hypothetical protein